MTDPPSLEQVKELAQQLSPEDRLKLWEFLAELPDSGVRTQDLGDIAPLELGGTRNVNAGNAEDNFVLISSPTAVDVWLKGRIIFQVRYDPENFRQSQAQIPMKGATPLEEIKERIKEEFTKRGHELPPDDEIIKNAQQAQRMVHEAETVRISNTLSSRLSQMTWLLLDGTINIIKIAIRNEFATLTGQTNKRTKLDVIEKILQPYWDHIKKQQLGVTAGGAHNIKHVWTDEQRKCLTEKSEEFRPIWIEAKRIAKAAQNSNEARRKREWRKEVLGVYENLPLDLLDRLATPRADDAKPSNIALVHAKRECGIEYDYSPRQLRDEIKAWKLKSSS